MQVGGMVFPKIKGKLMQAMSGYGAAEWFFINNLSAPHPDLR